MPTSLHPPTANVDSTGDLVSITLSGSSDECTDLRVEVLDAFGDVLLTSPVVFSGNDWSKTFTAPEDFSASDLVCDSAIVVRLKCRDSAPPEVLLEKSESLKCDPCSIAIDGIEGVAAASVSQGLQQLFLRGTASCARVVLRVDLNGSNELTQSDVPVVNGQWQATYAAAPLGVFSLKAYRCDSLVQVNVWCQDDEDCAAQAQLAVVCQTGPDPDPGPEPACPDPATVHVSGPNGFDRVDPTDAELECVPAGNYTLSCLTAAPSYAWRSNDLLVTGASSAAHVVSINGNTMVVSLAPGDNWHFSVSAQISATCTPLRTVAFHCGGANGCIVSEWSGWSPCRDGRQRRTRTVIQPPTGGGQPCPRLEESRDCPPDDVDCVVSPWSAWSACNGGQQMRTRTTVTPATGGGRVCPPLVQTRACTDIFVDLCLLWMLVNLGLVMVTAVLVFVAFCAIGVDTWAAVAAVATGGALSAIFATLTATIIILLLVALGFALLTLASWLLWIVVCLFISLRNLMCEAINFILLVLHVLMALAAAIGIIMLIASLFIGGVTIGCVVGAWVAFGYIGLIEQIFFWIGVVTGCIRPFAIFSGFGTVRRTG